MVIKQMIEGTYYTLGFADKNQPKTIYQLDLSASELKLSDSDTVISYFDSIDSARQAKEMAEKNLGKPVSIYRTTVHVQKVP